MEFSQVRAIEDRRWSRGDQSLVWRHEAALKLVTNEPVLDVGGGDGLFLSLLQERKNFTQLSLLDISPVAVEKARSKDLKARVADLTQPFPFADNTFETACALDVLEHLYDPLPALKEMGRVAKQVIAVVPNFNFIKERLQVSLGQVPFQCKPQRGGHVYWFNYQILKTLVTEAGLEIDVTSFGSFRRFSSLSNWLAKGNPNLFAYSFAVRLKKR